MSDDPLAKVPLVLPLHLGHRQQALDHLVASAFAREHRGFFVLDDVPALELSRAVHRHEPAADVAERAECAADAPEDRVANRTRLRVEVAQQTANELAVMPLFRFDLRDARAFRGITAAAPVAAIRESGGELARIRALQLTNELRARSGGIGHARRF